jgi:hypothetical protein
VNERFESLMYHAGMTAQGCWDEMDSYQREAVEKLALLIVRECANWINENVGMINEDARADLHKHFGVEKCHFTLTQTNVGIAEFKNERTNSRTS